MVRTVESGLVASHHGYFDQIVLLSQLGLIVRAGREAFVRTVTTRPVIRQQV
jgi:hypothetical protein